MMMMMMMMMMVMNFGRKTLNESVFRAYASISPPCKRSISSITRIGTDDPRMSRIVVHNDVVYISGLTDATAQDIEGQTRNVLAKVDGILEQAGTDKSQLLTSNIWLKDIGRDFKKMNDVWNNWLDPENKPVRATVEANMARPQLLIEMQVTAVKN